MEIRIIYKVNILILNLWFEMFKIPCKCGSDLKEYLHTIKEPVEVTFLCEACGEMKTISMDELRKLYAKRTARYIRG